MATKVAKYDLQKLVRLIEKRHIAVPEFQRGFVWKTAQVKKLFDSLINQYPVGSFILDIWGQDIWGQHLGSATILKRHTFLTPF